MIRWLLKTIAICIASFLGVLVVAYGLLALLSLQKAQLDPEVAAFLQREPIAVAPERNGFYYWRGLTAPAGENPIEYGRRSIAELGRQSPAADSGATRAEQELRLVHDRKILCHPANQMPCLVLARQNAAQVRELAKGNAELLRRYVALLQFNQFATDMPVLDPMDPWPMSRVEQFNLFVMARTLDAVDVSEGKSAEALNRLANRVRFLRGMYANSADLVDRVMAQALLTKDLEFLVEVAVAAPNSAKVAAAQVSAIAAPMTTAERSSLKWIRDELSKKFEWIDPGNPRAWKYQVCQAFFEDDFFNMLVMGNGTLEERCGRWDVRMLALAGAPLIDRNAVANRWFQAIRQLREINGLDTFSYLGRFREVVAAAESRQQADARWRLRNPVGGWIGTKLSTDLVAAYKSYHFGTIDLDRLFALTRLAVGLIQDRIKEGDIAAYLKRPGVLDPATKQPFGWDAARRQVFFVPLDPTSAPRGRVGGIDGRVGLSLNSLVER